MAFKALIFLGLLALALGFTLQGEQIDGYLDEPEWEYGHQFPSDNMIMPILLRRARSPQGRFEGRFENSRRMGSSASLDYTHPINKNWEAYGTASRNFKYNDNSGHAGLRFKF